MMGYIKHHAIVVTAYTEDLIVEAMNAAFSLGNTYCARQQIGGVNNDFSMVVFPDGSKEGWPESDHHDIARARFIDWLRAQRHEDGGSFYEWVEVSFSRDDREAIVTDHEWKDAPTTP